MKLRVIESEVAPEKAKDVPKNVTSFVNNMVAAAKDAIAPGVMIASTIFMLSLKNSRFRQSSRLYFGKRNAD